MLIHPWDAAADQEWREWPAERGTGNDTGARSQLLRRLALRTNDLYPA